MSFGSDNVNECLPVTNKIDFNEFDITVNALLIGVGAEKYINLFKKKNIGQSTLIELSDKDLLKLGVDDMAMRQKILREIENLPIYEEIKSDSTNANENLGPLEVIDILEETSQHLYRIYLSLLANTLAVKKTKEVADFLLYKDKYASNIAISTLSEITKILNSMDIALHTEMKGIVKDTKKKNKKILIGSLGTAVIAVLAVLFARSLKQLKQ